MTMQFVVDQNLAGAEDYLRAYGVVKLVDGRALCRQDLMQAQALLVRSVTRVDEALLAGTQVQFVGTATSGVDHIDKEYLLENKLGFAYAPGSNANSVVEYVLSAIAAVDQKLEQLFAGGTVGIVGFGHIGRLLADKLTALGIAFKVYDPWLSVSHTRCACGLAEILACDVISLHAELTHQEPWPSFHLLAAHELAQISPHSLLINASRGAVVDNLALLQLLEAGLGPALVMDVWEGEPDLSQALLNYVRFGSAHIAGYSMDGKLLATRMLRNAMAAHFGLGIDHELQGTAEDAPLLSISELDQNDQASCLRALLQQSYDIALDDSLLRAGVIGQTNAGLNFDTLRKQYRQRLEIAGRTVRADAPTDSTLELLSAMGCVVEQVKEVNQL
jgi:erythronate-4-phosphate dehydrogenase